jgi:hypothetical protein
MKNKKTVVVSFLVGSIISLSVIPVLASSGYLNRSLEKPPVYSVNEYGLTYGSAAKAVSRETEPDLISAVGIDGTKGYVYAKDLDEKMPKTPEEAVAMTKALKKDWAEKKAKGEKYLRLIPLYEVDGKTVIGKYGITIGELEN